MSARESFTQLRSWRLITLALVIIGLAILHQFGRVQESPFHQILDVIPYLPIILGSLWFGFVGGVSCSLLTSICYVTHLLVHEGGDLFAANLHRTLNIMMFNVVGVVTGTLAGRQLKTMAGYRRLALQLNESYVELRKNTEALFRAEEHLARMNRVTIVAELTAGLAHEIGNPLGGIKGAAEILADGIEPGDRKHRFAQLLLKEVDRLDSVVSRFLDSVRSHEVAGDRADLSEVLNASVSLCRRALERGNLELRIDVEDGLPPVRADPHQLEQVFLNLLLNAIQATPPGGRITLRAHRNGSAVLCSVIDTGDGIDPKIRSRLFDPFFTTRSGGTGLGLAITQKILQGCDGRIEVESQPGAGSTFTVRLGTREGSGAEEKSTDG